VSPWLAADEETMPKAALPKKDLPVKRFRTKAAWEKWLAAQHEKSAGVWLEFAKRNTGVASVSYAEALEVALCYGWIDGQIASVDQTWYRQRFTPRRPKSKWSQINRATVEKLHAAGRLSPAAIREMEAARRDGRWDAAYPSPSRMIVPDDLAAALEAEPRAKKTFEGLDSQNRYAILYRLLDAKRPETRQRRLEQFLQTLREGKKPLG
jgi:uncharacterized protein YdeI (YjbR/CyaY-like superfamily)